MTDREGYLAITPYFTALDADRLIRFLEEAFGGVIIKLTRTDDCLLQHARVRIEDSVVMLSQASGDYTPNVSQMHLFVTDADKTYTQALPADGISIMEPNLRPHGEWVACVEDPCGNRWWIASEPG